MRVLIADDEAPARRKLARFLREADGVEIVAEAHDGAQALAAIAATRPDVVFLDIGMPGLDGLAVARALDSVPAAPRVIFVTAFDAHALRAFDLGALDYLLKPVDRDRFERALRRARDARHSGAPSREPATIAETLARLRDAEPYARRLLIDEGERSYYVPVADVVRLEADGNDLIVHTRGGTRVMRATLESLEARLNPEQFARVHRSHVVNIDAVAEIRPWFHGDRRLVLRDGSEVPWSRRYAAKRPDLSR